MKGREAEKQKRKSVARTDAEAPASLVKNL